MVDSFRPEGNPKLETRPFLRRAGGKPRSAHVTEIPAPDGNPRSSYGWSRTGEPVRSSSQKPRHVDLVAVAITRSFRPGALQYAFQQLCFVDLVEVARLQLREHLGAFDPEFAFASSLKRGPVLRHATNSRLEEPVFGR